jgi:protein-S-isoprenylcysteine O-methyltransferase Ste14
MYIAVSLILVGWAVAYSSQPLLIYALAVMAMFYLRVVFGEEPWLARMHGEQWREYRARVRRWLSAAGTANCLKPQAASADWPPHAQR